MKSETVGYDALVDSDALVGLIWENDLLHEKAIQLFTWAQQQGLKLVTTSLVVSETATVLSYRNGQDDARRFLKFIETIDIIHVTPELYRASLDFFKVQTKKRTSMVDCSNIVVARTYAIPTILSFDVFYRDYLPLKAA